MKISEIVELMIEKILGFTKEDLGIYSVRSVGAMTMFLSGLSEIITQRIGKWGRFAFFDYIREQVDFVTKVV